jgi:hypothetical protein
MAICRTCEREMNEAEGCILLPIPTEDGMLNPIPYGSELHPVHDTRNADGTNRRCGDCGALPGNYHHTYCDIEECPRCHGQLFSCDCIVEEETIQ